MQAGEKLALKDTTKGDVIVKLVPLIDNFEAAKNSIKVQSDAEQKIVDSYQVGATEHELGSMWTGACGQHVDWCMWAACERCMWAACGLVHVPSSFALSKCYGTIGAFACSSCTCCAAGCGVHHAEPANCMATKQNGMTIALLQD